MSATPSNEITIIKSVETPVGSFYIRSDGIAVMELVEGFETDLEQVLESTELTRKCRDGNAHPTLILTHKSGVPTKEVREHMAANKRTGESLADAIVLTSLPLGLVGNLYLKINRPKVKSKIFSNKEDAIKWLEAFVAK